MKKQLLLCLGMLCLFLSLQAQVTTSAMTGYIMDETSNLPLPGANVLATHTPSGTVYGVITRDDGGYNIATQNLQNGRVILLTNSGMAQSPTIAPNGKMVAFAEIYDGSKILGMASIDGDVKLRLPAQEGNVQDPAWSPFLN